MEANPVSEKVLNAWKRREAESYEPYSDKYSSDTYRDPFFGMIVMDMGYVICHAYEGDAVLKIMDENHLEAFTTVPGDLNRDMFDIYVDGEGKLHTTLGCFYQTASLNGIFTAQTTEVPLQTGQAAWFDIDDSLANSCITINRPQNSAVYVYDRFGEVLYSSQMVDHHTSIPLPKGGRIVFLGENGGVAKIAIDEM